MTPAPVSSSLLPSRSMRAGMLAYIAALAAIEVCDGMIVAEAWRDQRQSATPRPEEIEVLGEMFERLRVIEGVVVVAAVVTTVLWSFLAVRNASSACRNGRSGSTAVVAWALVPGAVFVLCGVRGSTVQTAAVLAVQAAILFVPFATIGIAATRVGGRLAPFVRWYVALVLVFLVQQAFTGSFNLADPKPSQDLGRAAALMLANGLVLGLMVLMAADAAKSMEQATQRKMVAHLDWREEALQRFRVAVAPVTARSLPAQPIRTASAPTSMSAIPTMAPTQVRAEQQQQPGSAAVLVAAPAVAAAAPVPAPAVAAAPAVPAPVPAPAVVAAPAVPAPVVVATPGGVAAPVVAAQPVTDEPSTTAADAEPAPTPSAFAPLQPRSTPRSL